MGITRERPEGSSRSRWLAGANLLFILIIALNTVIGIVQELHAKKLVEQIAILTAPKARALRDGELREIPVEELVLGDVISLENGMQIPADALVLEGGIETDESLLTGESIPVRKGAGEELLSGSVVVSGTCMARVERVGGDNYAARLTQEAKAALPGHSELLTSMRKVTRFTGFLIPPLGLLLFLQAYFLRGAPLFDAVTTTAAFQAMRSYFPDAGGTLEPISKIPFSSQRKWSAMTFPEVGTLVVGAPDRMTGTAIPEALRGEIQRGKRVLFLACTREAVQPDSPLPEMNAGAVITCEDKNWKGPIAARFAILDPAYTASVPSMQVLSGAFDTLSHAMETYLGQSDRDNVSDDVALAIMKNTVANMRRLLIDINDMQARGNLMWDSTMAENGILKVGRVTDFQAHQIEHQLGAFTDCNHGQGLAVIRPAYYRRVVKDAEEKSARFGKVVFGVDGAEAAVEALTDFIKECGLPTKLSQLKSRVEITPELLRQVEDTTNLVQTGPGP